MTLRRISDGPAVWVDDAFLTRSACLHLMALGSDWGLIRACGQEPSHNETGFSWELPRAAHDAVEEVARRIEETIGLDDTLSYSLRFRRYSVGEAHPLHLDSYTVDGQTLVATAMVCLLGPVEGGDTRFPHAAAGPLSVRAFSGRLVVWANQRLDGTPDPASRHDGAVVLEGQKVTLTLFVYRPDPRARPTL